MGTQPLNYRIVWIVLACLVPLAALGVTIFFDAPVMPTTLLALLLLLPLARQLLANT